MRQILKANEVQFDAPVQLGLSLGTEAAAGNPQPLAAATPTPARARIAESRADHALVEVTCPCGQKTYIRCDYQPAQP